MRKIFWQAHCLRMVVTEELEELNRRTDVSKWLLRKVMLNDPDPEEEEECSSSPFRMMIACSHSHSEKFSRHFCRLLFFIVKKSGILLLSQKTYKRKGKFI